MATSAKRQRLTFVANPLPHKSRIILWRLTNGSASLPNVMAGIALHGAAQRRPAGIMHGLWIKQPPYRMGFISRLHAIMAFQTQRRDRLPGNSPGNAASHFVAITTSILSPVRITYRLHGRIGPSRAGQPHRQRNNQHRQRYQRQACEASGFSKSCGHVLPIQPRRAAAPSTSLGATSVPAAIIIISPPKAARTCNMRHQPIR